MARFLVVDDDHLTVDAMTRLLRDDGHDVVGHTSGADALEVLGRESFDAVIVDLEMPRVGGHEVARAVRDRSPNACVVLTTTHNSSHPHEHTCLMVEKPIDYDALTGAIAHCRAHGGQAAERCPRRSPNAGDNASDSAGHN